MRHFVIVGILVLVMTVLTVLGLNNAGLMPVQASAQAISIDWMWDWEVVVMSFLFALIVVPMAYSMIVFRRRKGDTTDAEHFEGNTNLEIAWTALPFVLVVIFAYMGAYSLGDISRVEPTAMVIKVRAQQFSWTFEYPEYGGIVSEELHLPVGQPVVLKMESRDVIHSFWVPEFRVKQDVVPGRVIDYRITPTLIGNYKVRCAELCGASHYNMERAVIVSNQLNFDLWVQEQQAVLAAQLQTPEGVGQLLAVRNGCTSCHSTDGPRMTGPTWFNLYGSVVPLDDGSTVIADDAFIHESIVDPNAKIVAGFQSPSQMPSFESVLSDEDIANIIAYIKTLK
jgi:cytochrome c oxidase subunit 2